MTRYDVLKEADIDKGMSWTERQANADVVNKLLNYMVQRIEAQIEDDKSDDPNRDHTDWMLAGFSEEELRMVQAMIRSFKA
jgi:hypothetical protein